MDTQVSFHRLIGGNKTLAKWFAFLSQGQIRKPLGLSPSWQQPWSLLCLRSHHTQVLLESLVLTPTLSHRCTTQGQFRWEEAMRSVAKKGSTPVAFQFDTWSKEHPGKRRWQLAEHSRSWTPSERIQLDNKVKLKSTSQILVRKPVSIWAGPIWVLAWGMHNICVSISYRLLWWETYSGIKPDFSNLLWSTVGPTPSEMQRAEIGSWLGKAGEGNAASEPPLVGFVRLSPQDATSGWEIVRLF